MAVDLELDPLVEEVNAYLRHQQKVHKDDPILTNVIINKVILNRYVESVELALEKSHHQISAATKVEMEAAKQTTARMIETTGNYLEKQLLTVGETWESKFKQAAQEELHKVRQAALLAYIGAGALALAGAIALGLVGAHYLGLMTR